MDIKNQTQEQISEQINLIIKQKFGTSRNCFEQIYPERNLANSSIYRIKDSTAKKLVDVNEFLTLLGYEITVEKICEHPKTLPISSFAVCSVCGHDNIKVFDDSPRCSYCGEKCKD